MNETENKIIRRKISPLDVFVVILVILSIAGLVARAVIGKEGVLPEKEPSMEEHAVGFKISGIKMTDAASLTNGVVLYAEDGSRFGTISAPPTFTPASVAGKGDGAPIAGENPADADMSDVNGTLMTEGYFTDQGYFVNGKTYASPNWKLTLHTDEMTFTVIITDVSSTGN